MYKFLNDPPEILREKFCSLAKPSDLANLLEIEYSKLILYAYVIPLEKQYITFLIPKKSGGQRKISAPKTPLKILQAKLAQVFRSVYDPSSPVHGYVNEKSILTNAKLHARSRFVFNLDIKDFFPAINFGRVRGLLIKNHNVPLNIATIMAQICCYNNQLPQGAPTSPIISNMICSRMDKELLTLAQKESCNYTRYADDLTFSTSDYYFPGSIARPSRNAKGPSIKIGEELIDIIDNNGFQIHPHKARLQRKSERQVVTGLVVNRFPNVHRKFVRQIRAMLHAWRKFGHDKAEERYYEKYAKAYRNPDYKKPLFKSVVRGKIEFLGMVKGKNNPVYIRYWNQLVTLAPEHGQLIHTLSRTVKSHKSSLVFTEGKTDAKHLQSALNWFQRKNLFPNLDIHFYEVDDDSGFGHDNLMRMCENYARTENQKPTIFIFDRDVPGKVRNRVKANDTEEFKSWGNNVFSFLLPIPSNREDDPNSVCIELYYYDEDLKKKDAKGRRLFLNREFGKSGRHKTLDLVCQDRNKIRSPELTVIDSEIYDKDENNIALSKNDFANLIKDQKDGFIDIEFSEFSKVLDIIQSIQKASFKQDA